MKIKVLYHKRLFASGTVYNCRLNVFATPSEMLVFNTKVSDIFRNSMNKTVKSENDLNIINNLNQLYPGDNYTSLTTAKYFCDHIGKYDDICKNRNTVIRINLK